MTTGTGARGLYLPITREKRLLVEGPNEEEIFKRLISHEQIPGIDVRSYEGKDYLRRSLEGLDIVSGFRRVTSLGVIRDADSNAVSALQSVQGALNNAGFATPDAPLVSAGASPKVTVAILPLGETQGMLEDVLLASVNNDPAFECIDEYFECVEEHAGREPKNLSKARVQVFLADGNRSGLFPRYADWPWDSSAFSGLKTFLQTLRPLHRSRRTGRQ